MGARTICTFLIVMACCLMATVPMAGAADVIDTADPARLSGNASVDKAVESETAVITGETKKEYKIVDSEVIPLDITASLDLSSAAKNDVDSKIRAEYNPVRVTIINKSGKLLKIERDAVFLVDSQGVKTAAPTEDEVFKNVKRNGVVRAMAWGVPLGVVSFGILAGPALVTSGAHTKITNGSVKANLQQNCFRGGHLSPEGSITTMIFIPKKKRDITKLMFARVIGLDDEIETEKIVEIDTVEIVKKNGHAKKS